MTVLLALKCSGCDATAETEPLYAGARLSSVVPDGWMLFDPYTHVTYCPDCWESIERGDGDTQRTAGQIADDMEADMQAARDGLNPNR